MITTENIPKLIMTSYMKRCAKLVYVILEVILDITNCVRSHMKFIRKPLATVLLITMCTSYQRYMFMILNGNITFQDKYSSLFWL